MARKDAPDAGKLDRLVTEARRAREEREKGYREQAMKLYPWICGRCGREFSGAILRMLTVHHKDGNHDNNPADGSNWELLCTYCHEHEHSKLKDAAGRTAVRDELPAATHNPFAGLKAKLDAKRDKR